MISSIGVFVVQPCVKKENTLVVEGRTVDMAELRRLVEDFAGRGKSLYSTEVLHEVYEGATVFHDMFPLDQA